MSNTKTAFVHLFNSYTGSPMVLAQFIRCTSQNPDFKDATLITNKTEGALSELDIEYNLVNYIFTPNRKIITLIRWLWAQIQIFFKLIKLKPNRVIINTIHPFGGMIYAFLFRKENIIYVHEYEFGNKFITKFLFVLVKRSKNIIVVSKHLKDSRPELVKAKIIANGHSIKHDFQIRDSLQSLGIVSMGNFDKKGVHAFFELAKRFKKLKFILQTGLDKKTLDLILKDFDYLPDNIEYRTYTNDMYTFYKDIDLILNLSNPIYFVETFGLTIIEGQAYGIPAIVPNVGGPSEIVNHKVDGYLVDPTDIDLLEKIVKNLKEDTLLYKKFCEAAYNNSLNYSPQAFCQKVNQYMSELN